MTTFRLATRTSDLAVRQTASVRAALQDRRHEADLVRVETTGDKIRDELIHRLGKTGAFVRSLDERVLEGDADAAVHSMKDVPTEGGDGLILAAIPERGPPGDVLVTPDGRGLDELPDGAVVGTSSLRRRAQLLAARPDLQVEPLRGNVDTRVQKLLAPSLQAEHERRIEAEKERKGDRADNEDYEHPYDRDPEEWFEELSELQRQALEREVETEFDAIVLAEAGLDRLGLLRHVEFQRLPIEEFLPAPGQGALAVVAPDDGTARTLNDALDHPRTRVETTVERAILAELGGGCVAPIGVHAVLQGGYVSTRVAVYGPDGEEVIDGARDLDVEDHAVAARRFASDLADRGAAELIAAATEGPADEETGGDAADADDAASSISEAESAVDDEGEQS